MHTCVFICTHLFKFLLICTCIICMYKNIWILLFFLYVCKYVDTCMHTRVLIFICVELFVFVSCVCIYLCMGVCVLICTCYMYLYVSSHVLVLCVCIYVCISAYKYMDTCMHTRVLICIRITCMHILMYRCMCTYIYFYMYLCVSSLHACM